MQRCDVFIAWICAIFLWILTDQMIFFCNCALNLRREYNEQTGNAVATLRLISLQSVLCDATSVNVSYVLNILCWNKGWYTVLLSVRFLPVVSWLEAFHTTLNGADEQYESKISQTDHFDNLTDYAQFQWKWKVFVTVAVASSFWIAVFVAGSFGVRYSLKEYRKSGETFWLFHDNWVFTEFAEFSDKNICRYGNRAQTCHPTMIYQIPWIVWIQWIPVPFKGNSN